MNQLHTYDEQPPQILSGEELLALVPTASTFNTERLDFIARTQRFIDAHRGKIGTFFWGIAVTETEHHPELGFVSDEELSNLDIAI